jgi:hypothetical protein
MGSELRGGMSAKREGKEKRGKTHDHHERIVIGNPNPKAYAQRCSICRTRSPNGQPFRTQCPLRTQSRQFLFHRGEGRRGNELEAVVSVDDRGVDEGERSAEEGDEAESVEEGEVVESDESSVALLRKKGSVPAPKRENILSWSIAASPSLLENAERRRMIPAPPSSLW